MPACVSSTLNLFADDTVLYREISSRQDAELLQQDTNSLANWSKKNELPFNPSKSEFISFTRKRSTKVTMEYRLEGVVIPEVTTIKYLGVKLDNALLMREHVGYVVQKMCWSPALSIWP